MYYGGIIQEGFGLLMADAGIEMRDWTSHFRSPYWNHEYVQDWSASVSNFTVGVPKEFALSNDGNTALPSTGALFLPLQWLFVNSYTVCCGPVDKFCRERPACTVSTMAAVPARPPPRCCIRKKDFKFNTPEVLQQRSAMSVPRLVGSPRCGRVTDEGLRGLSIVAARRMAQQEADAGAGSSAMMAKVGAGGAPATPQEMHTACNSGLLLRPSPDADNPFLIRTNGEIQ